MPVKRIWILYCRCSRFTQGAKHFSIETQEAEGNEFAKREGIQIFKVIKDSGQSWSSFDRDGLGEAIDILKRENKKKIVVTDFICMDQSRLSRNDDLMESLFMTKEIRKYWAHINYIMYPIDTESSIGILQEQMLYSFAAFERRNIVAKSKTGMRMRLLDGYRPFAILPAGYKREWEGKNKKIIFEKFKSSILKEALEMYANGVILSDSWFYKYLSDKWFTSNTNKNIHPSIVHTIFSDHRLYFYAWFLYYPPRELDKPILWKQPALISLETMEKIKNRRANSGLIGKTKDGQDSEFPLKELIKCPECHRKITGYFAKWRNERFPYYGCQKAWCKNRFCVNRKVFNEQFTEFLDSIQVTDTMMDVFKLWLETVWNNRQEFESVRKQELQSRIQNLTDNMQGISKKVIAIKGTDMLAALEHQWEEYKLEKEELQKQLDNDIKISQDTFEELIVNAEKIFKQPRKVFELWNKELQKMTIALAFGDQIFYSKKKKFRTPQKSLLNLIFSNIRDHETTFIYNNKKNGEFEHQFPWLYSLFQNTKYIDYKLS